MENSTKNLLTLGGAAIAGGWGGSWAAGRLGAALGVSLGPWGAAAGGVLGAMLGTSLAKNLLGVDTENLPDPGAMVESATETVTEAAESVADAVKA